MSLGETGLPLAAAAAAALLAALVAAALTAAADLAAAVELDISEPPFGHVETKLEPNFEIFNIPRQYHTV
jgi:hypothetical protein